MAACGRAGVVGRNGRDWGRRVVRRRGLEDGLDDPHRRRREEKEASLPVCLSVSASAGGPQQNASGLWTGRLLRFFIILY